MKQLLLAILFSSFAFSKITVISKYHELSKITQQELANLYLKKSNTLNGIKVIPIDSKDKKLFQEFYRKLIKENPKQLHAYWIKEIYRGDKQPPKKLSPQVLKKVMKNKTPIVSYVKNPKTGKILLTIK